MSLKHWHKKHFTLYSACGKTGRTYAKSQAEVTCKKCLEAMGVIERKKQYRPKPKGDKLRGISYHKDHALWIAQIRLGGKSVYIGSYTTEVAAATVIAQIKDIFSSSANVKQMLALWAQATGEQK